MQCTTVDGVQVDVSIGGSSGPEAAAYMNEQVPALQITVVSSIISAILTDTVN